MRRGIPSRWYAVDQADRLADPEVEVRPTQGQIDDLIDEDQTPDRGGQRVLVTTLTKKMAEDLSEYLADVGIKVHYLHSEIKTSNGPRSCATCGLGCTMS